MSSYSFDSCGECKTDIKIVLKDKGKKTGPQFIGRNPHRKEILEVKNNKCEKDL